MFRCYNNKSSMLYNGCDGLYGSQTLQCCSGAPPHPPPPHYICLLGGLSTIKQRWQCWVQGFIMWGTSPCCACGAYAPTSTVANKKLGTWIWPSRFRLFDSPLYTLSDGHALSSVASAHCKLAKCALVYLGCVVSGKWFLNVTNLLHW